MITLDQTAAGWAESSIGQRLDAVTNAHLLHLPLSTPVSYRVGSRHLEAYPGKAVFLGAGTAYQAAYGAGRWFAIQFAAARLDETLRMLRGAHRANALRSRELALTPKVFASLGQILNGIGDSPPDRRQCERIETELTEWMASLLLADLPVSASGRLAAGRLLLLEDWIDEHLAEPLRLAHLCEVADIDLRGLQKSFLLRRGMTPMQWLRDRRLGAARLRLLRAKPEDTVTTIALRSGFPQLGRFAIAYRERYGESPRETLKAVLER
jgi:AraC-like DNA-binding protein